MDVANYELFKQAFERLHQQSKNLSRTQRKREPSRRSAGSLSPEELVKATDQLAKEAADLASVSRAKCALLLRRDRALKRAGRLCGSNWLK
jgi:hypothetical protein